VVHIGELPLFNEDIEKVLPESIKTYRESIKNSDGFVFATCEYNSSISAAMKNAIDWGSRGENLFNNKPAAVMGAGGYAGTTRAQSHLREVLAAINTHVLTHPELRVEIYKEPRPFDAKTGDLVCANTKQKVGWSMAAFAQYLTMVNSSNLEKVSYRPA